MTNSLRSPVTRETGATSRRRPLIVTLAGYVIEIREKGRRFRVEVPIEAVYDLAMRLKARQERAERKRRGP